MSDPKKIKNLGSKFPCGTLEEMLRMMRECQEKGDINCEIIMKEFMGKEFRSVDYKKIKKKFFGEVLKPKK